MTIYNFAGQAIARESFSGALNKVLPSGAYIVKVQSQNQIQTAKVIIP